MRDEQAAIQSLFCRVTQTPQKRGKRKKQKVSGSIHDPVIVLVCAVTKVYISNFVACFSERDGRCDPESFFT